MPPTLAATKNHVRLETRAGEGENFGMDYQDWGGGVRVAMAACLLLVACADGDGSTTFSSGVDRGKSLSDLTPDEQQAICREGERFRRRVENDLRDGLCQLAGHLATALSPSDADARTACQDSYQECVNGPQEPSTDLDVPSTCPSFRCTSAVGQFEDCVNGATEATLDYLASVPSCANARAWANGTIPSGEPPRLEACRAFERSCP